MITQRVKVTIVARDGKSRTSFTRLWLPAGTSLASAQSKAESMVAVMRAVSDAEIYQFSISYGLKNDVAIEPITNLLASPLAVFSFTLTDIPDTYYTFITPLDPSWVLDSGPLAGFGIDLTNSEVIALTDEITNGDWVDPFNNDIGAIYSAATSEAP